MDQPVAKSSKYCWSSICVATKGTAVARKGFWEAETAYCEVPRSVAMLGCCKETKLGSRGKGGGWGANILSLFPLPEAVSLSQMPLSLFFLTEFSLPVNSCLSVFLHHSVLLSL